MSKSCFRRVTMDGMGDSDINSSQGGANVGYLRRAEHQTNVS